MLNRSRVFRILNKQIQIAHVLYIWKEKQDSSRLLVLRQAHWSQKMRFFMVVFLLFVCFFIAVNVDLRLTISWVHTWHLPIMTATWEMSGNKRSLLKGTTAVVVTVGLVLHLTSSSQARGFKLPTFQPQGSSSKPSCQNSLTIFSFHNKTGLPSSLAFCTFWELFFSVSIKQPFHPMLRLMPVLSAVDPADPDTPENAECCSAIFMIN